LSERSNIRRALIMDAVSQVLDNRVFRILFGLSTLFVAFTFLVGFREDSVVLFFGYQEYFYEDFFRWMPFAPQIGGTEQQQAGIDWVQNFFASQSAGTFGILFCLAATSFFMPQILEKGFADSFFSKPVTRWQLLVSRYVASILLIAFLAFLLVSGIYLGLLTASGYSDPGFLWSAPTLIYLFALVSGFTVFWGCMTRNTIATLLLTMISYGFTSGVHTAWTGIELFRESPVWEEIERAREEGRSTNAEVAFQRFLIHTVDVLHYTLPKTHDAKFITANLRDRMVTEERERGVVRVEVDDDGEQQFVERDNPFGSYEDRLTWTGPLATNLSFSIVSSLLFVLACLGLAWTRIRRISF
jgi:ABC-type transport system involved in multi-copper enzyme maturation permease subunit